MATRTRFGILESDSVPDDGHLKKLAATAVTHWVERFLIPAQNVFVDAPHLAQRQPGLVKVEPSEWDVLADLSAPDTVRAALDTETLVEAATTSEEWISRPVWDWSKVARTSARFTEEFPVFCEDISRFRPIDDAVEFNSSVPGPLRQRFVAELESTGTELPIAYDPILRLA